MRGMGVQFGYGVLIAVAVAAHPARAEPPIRYTVSLYDSRLAPSLTVEVAFVGDADGRSEVDLPSQWAGSERLEKHLADMTVIGGTMLPGSSPAKRLIRHRPRARLILRYRILDAQPGLPEAQSYEKARPVVEADWFYVHTEGAFAIPAGREKSPARFRWGPLPRGWRTASDLDLTDAGTLTANGAASAILIGGKALRISKRSVAGRPVLLAALGRWAFTDAELADRLAVLIGTENAMLGATAKPYLVTLVPLTGSERGAVSYGGSGRTSGFALTSTDNVPLGDFTRLLAHEYAHRWFGEGWGPFAEGAADYWFTEGFDDWFAARAMVRSGLWKAGDWRDATNAMLLRYASSTARALTDAELSAQFWTNPDAMQVQYDRGNLAASILDAGLRRRNGSLLAVLAGMAATDPRAGDGGLKRLDRLAGAEAVAQARERAAAALLPAATFGACGSLRSSTQPAYDRGFTMTADDKVDSVPAGSPAQKAGLRPGFVFKRRISTSWGDSTKPYTAEFLDGAATRRLTWLPEGERKVSFQRLAGDDIDSPACAALLR